jgi:hypothetical protein
MCRSMIRCLLRRYLLPVFAAVAVLYPVQSQAFIQGRYASAPPTLSVPLLPTAAVGPDLPSFRAVSEGGFDPWKSCRNDPVSFNDPMGLEDTSIEDEIDALERRNENYIQKVSGAAAITEKAINTAVDLTPYLSDAIVISQGRVVRPGGYVNMFEKLEVLKKARAAGELTIHFWWPGKGAPNEFVHDLNDYGWLPKDYIQFLTGSDGASFDNFVLYGSGIPRPRQSVWKLRNLWAKFVPMADVFPIGVDPNGSVFCICREGCVLRYSSEPPFSAEHIADDFASLVCDVFLGERFLAYFGELDPKETVGDEWVEFLQRQGWLHLRGIGLKS